MRNCTQNVDSLGQFARQNATRLLGATARPLAPWLWFPVLVLMAVGILPAQNPLPQSGVGASGQQQTAAAAAPQAMSTPEPAVGAAITRTTVGPPNVTGAADAYLTPVAAPQKAPTSAAPAATAGQPITRVSRQSGTLPRDHGQVWDEYDITPYTSRVTGTAKPERAIVDWILLDTGTETWFSEPLGVLSASSDKLRVYHTPEIQGIVSGIVDRFVQSKGQADTYNVRLVTVGNPNWRATALHLMRPVGIETPGIEAWLLTKENAALLTDQLRKRTDYRDRNSSALVIQNGQAAAISLLRPTSFMRSVLFRPGTWPGYEVQNGQVEEGFSLELNVLKSLDGATIDAVVKCQVDQVERMLPVTIDVPQANQTSQIVQIQVPQMVSWRLHERFRWPANEVLLISAGVVATPETGRATAPTFVPNPFKLGAPRADGLMFVDYLGPTVTAAATAAATAAGETAPQPRTGAIDVRGRY